MRKNFQEDNKNSYFQKTSQKNSPSEWPRPALSILEKFNLTLKEQFLPENFTPALPTANQKLTEKALFITTLKDPQSLGYLNSYLNFIKNITKCYQCTLRGLVLKNFLDYLY